MKTRITKMLMLMGVLFFAMAINTKVSASEEVVPEAPKLASNSSAKIIEGIYIDGVNVSGMTKDQAKAAVDKHLSEISGYNIKMQVVNKTAIATAGELGLTWDGDAMIEKVMSIGKTGNLVSRFKVREDLKKGDVRLVLPYRANRASIERIIEERCVPFDSAPVNATMEIKDGDFVIEQEKSGISVDAIKSADIVEEYMTKLWRAGGGEVEIAAEIKMATHTKEGLKDVRNVLGTAETDYSSSSASRGKNIRTGTQKVNGTVLFPGEEYSVCDAMVPFSEENGYALGASYYDGEIVDSLGGGICQVSTTLYLALLRSEIEILERQNHSMTVKYVKLSMDAAIAEGSKDLRFKNNLDSPIFIQGYADGGNVGFVIYGKEYRPEGREVEFESETIETFEPNVELVAAGDFGKIEQLSQSQTGYIAKLWKVVRENGKETRTQVNDSNYQMQPAKYEVGVNGATGEAAEAIYSAIENNDLDAAFSAVYKYG